FADYLGKTRLVALTRRHRPQHEFDDARWVYRDLGALAWCPGIELDRSGNADAATAAAPARLGPAPLEPRPVAQFRRAPQRCGVIAAVINETQRISVRHRVRCHEIAPTDLNAVKAVAAAGDIDQALKHEHDLRAPSAAVG